VPSETAVMDQHILVKRKNGRLTHESGSNGAYKLRKAAVCVNHLYLKSIIGTQVEELVELQRDMCNRIGTVIQRLANGYPKNRRSE